MKETIKLMAMVKKEYEIDTSDKDAMKRAEDDFANQKVGDLAFHYFPQEKEVEL